MVVQLEVKSLYLGHSVWNADIENERINDASKEISWSSSGCSSTCRGQLEQILDEIRGYFLLNCHREEAHNPLAESPRHLPLVVILQEETRSLGLEEVAQGDDQLLNLRFGRWVMRYFAMREKQ